MRAWGLLLVAFALAPAARADSPWEVPPPGACAPTGGLRGWPLGEDAPPIGFQPGEVIPPERAEALRAYLPVEVWSHRDKFFFEGMRLEIGPCFRDYSPPAFFGQASEAQRGVPRLAPEGGLEGQAAGLPFHPADIALDDPRAGLKWAWNVEHRYQGAGFRARFRIVDMVGRTHRGEAFEGEIFKALLAFRADRAAPGFKAEGAKDYHFVAGGLFAAPFAAREFAWRQYRNAAHQTEPARTDDLHAWLPEWRRVRRISAQGVEGLYLPSFSVGVVPSQQLAVGGGGADTGAAGGLGAGGVGAPASITPRRNGYEGLELRPLLWDYRVLGVQDLLAPANAASPAYPDERERNFGPWGLSFASDRWDLRRALVLEASIRNAQGESDVARALHYVDLQTLQPLYYVSWDKSGELMDVGVYVGRWSEDRPDYPRWPDDPAREVRVIDSVGAAFANVREGGGWRRESWGSVSTPPPDDELQRLLSVGQLNKRR
jgi:hypothetical protein